MTTGALERLASLSPRGMKLGLSAIVQLLERLGSPQNRVPRVLIAGTNGKGSTAATLSAIFHAAGIRGGLHTSPHLVDVTERVRVAERDVSPGQFAAALDAVFDAADREPAIPLTYFEAVTAAADQVFAGERCEFAVVEVGLGGRLDATNAADPLISIVTSIDFDHMADLGDTLPAIAREKAGIFRRGRVALCGPSAGPAYDTLRDQAQGRGAIFHTAAELSSDEESPQETAGEDAGQQFVLRTRRRRYLLQTPLRGEHQRGNIALAVLGAEFLSEDFAAITPEAIVAGVAQTRWPGRLERLDAGGRLIWTDGCHNPGGGRAIAAFLDSRPEKFDLLFGGMADKDLEGIAAEIFPRVNQVILCAPAVERAETPRRLAERLSKFGTSVETASSVASGLDRLLAESANEILVAGSLFLVGEVRSLLFSRAALRRGAA